MAAALLGGLVLFVPAIAADVALHGGDAATLRNLGVAWPHILIGAAVLGAIGAAITWFQTAGRHRTGAGAEPATRLTFTATASGLAIADGTGGRLEAAWPRWRISVVRATVWPRSKGSSLDVLESLRPVLLSDDGTSAGSVTLDPSTLTEGRDIAATILGMITSAAVAHGVS